MSRRKSTVHVGRPRDDSPALELERLEQATTLVLQEIDHNLSRANSIISDAIFPVLQKYAGASAHAWANAGFWKHFLEEAADVEINTLDQPLEQPGPDAGTGGPQKPQKLVLQLLQKLLDPVGLDPDTPPGSDRGIETSTPQLRRTPSPQRLPRRGPQLAVSPRKRTPAARRLLVLQNFLNLLPTLPEPPVLLSERGRAAASSSSAPARTTSPDLGRLLPVPLSAAVRDISASATPGARAQRFPLTPSFAAAAPAPAPAPTFNDSDLAAPAPTARQDESDLLPFPRLQTLGGDAWLGGSPKRRRVDHGQGDGHNGDNHGPNEDNDNGDNDNVFLERAHSSTVYHSMVEVKPSRSMSDIFDEVLLEHIPGITLEPQEPELGILRPIDNRERDLDTNDPNMETNMETRNPNEETNIPGLDPILNSPGDSKRAAVPNLDTPNPRTSATIAGGAVGAQAGSGAPDFHSNMEMANSPPGSHPEAFGFDTHPNLSLDSSANTSELGSFLGERWKSLSRSLRKK